MILDPTQLLNNKADVVQNQQPKNQQDQQDREITLEVCIQLQGDQVLQLAVAQTPVK